MDDLSDRIWYKKLPEVNEQIQFLKNAWEKARNGEEVIMTKHDAIMIEAILGTLCAAKMLTYKI